MMQNKKEIKTLISDIALTFIGMWAFVINLIDVFYEEDFYNKGSMICVVLLFSVIFGVLMQFIKKNWIVLVSCISIMGIVVWTNFDAIAGGLAYCINVIIEQYGLYFGKSMLYIDYTKSMLRDYDPAFFTYLVVILLTLIYSFAINKKKLAFIPAIFTLAGLFIPVIIEMFPSGFAMLLAVIYLVMLMVINNARTSDIASFVAACFGTVVLIVGGMVSLIVPADEFEQNEFFPDFREEVKIMISDNIENVRFWEGGHKTPAIMGGGALGHVDSLRFSNVEVMKITVPAVRDTIYIKGYLGQDYSSDGWKSPSEKETDLFKQLANVNYSPAGMVPSYLESLGLKGTLTGLKGKIKIEYTAATEIYNFSPIYTVISKDMTPSHDGTINSIPEGEYVEYFSVPEEVFKVSEEYIKEALGERYYSNNKLYMDYVYENYMDVNTPIADELKAQWSKYPVDTASERYIVAEAIKNYLHNTCTYTLSPGKVPEDKDFVEYFLKETHEGYCTYFATSAVMMFRSAGIPARYVEGYSVGVSSNAEVVEYGSTYVYTGTKSERLTGYCEVSVKDSNAHAWVEFYIDGIGWVDYEVTPSNGTIGSSQEKDDYNMNPEYFGEEPTTEEPTTEEPTSEEESTTDSESEEETTTKETTTTKPTKPGETTKENESSVQVTKPDSSNFRKMSGKALKVILIALAAVIVLFGGVLLVIVRHKKLADLRNEYNNSEQNLGKLAVHHYMYYLKLMSHIKIIKPDYMTNKEFADYVADKSDFVEKEEVRMIAEMQEKAEFAPELLDINEINNCKQHIENIRERIYASKNRIQKLIFKYIHNM